MPPARPPQDLPPARPPRAEAPPPQPEPHAGEHPAAHESAGSGYDTGRHDTGGYDGGGYDSGGPDGSGYDDGYDDYENYAPDEVDEPAPPPKPKARSGRGKKSRARQPVVRRADPGVMPPPKGAEPTSQWQIADYDDVDHDEPDNRGRRAGNRRDDDRENGYDGDDDPGDGYDDGDYRDGYDDEDDLGDYPRYPVSDDERPKRRKLVLGIGVLLVVLLVGFGVWLGMREFLGIGYADYDGAGNGDVLVRVQSGDSSADIGTTLQQAGVVASAEAFSSAGENNDELRSIQPGYYVMRKQMSGAAAVSKLTEPDSRVGELQVEPGTRLDDTKLPTGKVVAGIYSKLSKASCATLDGRSTCVSARTLRQTVADTDPAELGVPDWALADVRKAEPDRRLEGLVAPDVYQIRPGDDAKTLLKTVMVGSVARMQADGLPSIAEGTGYSPYQVLVMASLVQSEAVQADFGKVARVTYNRLRKPMRLQYDSTINYRLDRPLIRTSSKDRDRAGPYNTYGREGLPPTPISAPSTEAVAAAAKPDAGGWLYFVKCEKNGLSCFADTLQEHERNIKDAQSRGVY